MPGLPMRLVRRTLLSCVLLYYVCISSDQLRVMSYCVVCRCQAECWQQFSGEEAGLQRILQSLQEIGNPSATERAELLWQGSATAIDILFGSEVVTSHASRRDTFISILAKWKYLTRVE